MHVTIISKGLVTISLLLLLFKCTIVLHFMARSAMEISDMPNHLSQGKGKKNTKKTHF